MIQTIDSKDLATSFSRSLGAPYAAHIIQWLLARAFVPKDARGPPAKVGLRINDFAAAKLRHTQCLSGRFETELLRTRQDGRPSMDARIDSADPPLIIIDGLVKSQENSDFVGALYEAVYESNITALILVKDKLGPTS